MIHVEALAASFGQLTAAWPLSRSEQEVSRLADAKAGDATSVYILWVFWGKNLEYFMLSAGPGTNPSAKRIRDAQSILFLLFHSIDLA